MPRPRGKRPIRNNGGHDRPKALPKPKLPSKPAPVSTGIYKYDGFKSLPFYIRDHPMPDPGFRLNEPLPHALELQERLKDLRVHKELLSYLDYFGIPYNPDDSTLDLAKLMQESLRLRKVVSVAPSIAAIRDELRREWEIGYRRFRIEMEQYESEFKKWALTTFANKPTLSKKALFSGDLFIDTYYLDRNGNPDRTKLPNVAVLEGIPLRRVLDETFKRRVQGLHADSHFWRLVRDGVRHWKYGPGTVVVGWDADEVKAAMAEVRVRENEKMERERLRGQEERYGEHLKYLLDPAKARPTILGRYLVHCPALEGPEGYKSHQFQGGLYLTIRSVPVDSGLPPGVYLANLDFGIHHALLILCADRKVIRQWFEEPAPYAEQYEEDEWLAEQPRDVSMSGPGKTGENTTLWTAREGKRSVPLKYHFKFHDCNGFNDGRQDEADSRLGYGRILFHDDTFTSFGAEIDLGIVPGLSFLGAAKVGDPTGCGAYIVMDEIEGDPFFVRHWGRDFGLDDREFAEERDEDDDDLAGQESSEGESSDWEDVEEF